MENVCWLCIHYLYADVRAVGIVYVLVLTMFRFLINCVLLIHGARGYDGIYVCASMFDD